MDTVPLRRDHRRLLEQVERAFGFEQIVGQSPAMRRLFETIDKIADTDVTVLIRGGSGTGKELVANALHYRSPRRTKPLVKMNCAALSQELVESELFGHEKGAFTGAIARREGKFEAADGGTLFLDEVGDMPLETQAKLLRAIQEKEFERIGGNAPIRVDVRLIAATHHDLEAEVGTGRFREDLYYRLHVVEVLIPPLRDRRGPGRRTPASPRPAPPRSASSPPSNVTSSCRRSVVTAATSPKRPRRSACTARPCSRKCGSSASQSTMPTLNPSNVLGGDHP